MLTSKKNYKTIILAGTINTTNKAQEVSLYKARIINRYKQCDYQLFIWQSTDHHSPFSIASIEIIASRNGILKRDSRGHRE